LIGSAFAPILILLADTIRIHPMVLFGLFNGITVFLVLSLRETRGKKLLDYIGQ
jgi:hypothetical protein